MVRKSEVNIFQCITLTLVFFILSCGCVTNPISGSHQRIERINESIDKGIDFLAANQMDNGEFKTFASRDQDMRNSYFESSPFITPFVLYSIREVNNEKVPGIIEKGTNFLLSEQQPGGVWQFWGSSTGYTIPPDLDDIAMISAVLEMNNKSFDPNKELILSNKNDEGLFLTWIRSDGKANDVECVVNANVIFYLKEDDPVVCSYINDAIKFNKPCVIWYPNKMVLYYAVSRNLKHNLSCFEESREPMVKSVLAQQRGDGSFGTDLDTAFAINTLLNCGYTGIEVSRGIDNLLKKQNPGGSWTKSPFFINPFPDRGPTINYGSEELNTALAVEALNNYLAHQKAQDTS